MITKHPRINKINIYFYIIRLFYFFFLYIFIYQKLIPINKINHKKLSLLKKYYLLYINI